MRVTALLRHRQLQSTAIGNDLLRARERWLQHEARQIETCQASGARQERLDLLSGFEFHSRIF